VELITRMMDGSITYDPEGRLEPVLPGPGAKQEDKIERLQESRSLKQPATAPERRPDRTGVRIAQRAAPTATACALASMRSILTRGTRNQATAVKAVEISTRAV